jgi:hypothetical protein
LVEHIKRNLKKGYDINSLKWALINQGHSKTEVEKALAIAEEEVGRERPRQIAMPEPKTEIMQEEPKEEKKGFWKKIFG